MAEIAKYEVNYEVRVLKRMVRLDSTQSDSTESMYIAMSRFNPVPENGSVVKVVISIQTGGQ